MVKLATANKPHYPGRKRICTQKIKNGRKQSLKLASLEVGIVLVTSFS